MSRENKLIIGKDISVALCTCEGSLFLAAQLESLAKQTVLPKELVIYDDASTDSTVELAKRFAKDAPFKVHISINSKRLGVINNFSRAIVKCSGKYIALCDQDDIWYPNRLEVSLKAVVKAEIKADAPVPVLVHSDMTIVNEDNQIIADSYMDERKIRNVTDDRLGTLIVQNYLTGNTMMFNDQLKEIALPIPRQAIMHDWWLALVAAASGEIVYIKRPTVYYRQHQHNVIGLSKFISMNSLKKIIDKQNKDLDLAKAINQLSALNIHLKNKGFDLPPKILKFIDGVAMGGTKALKQAIKAKVRKQGIMRNIY